MQSNTVSTPQAGSWLCEHILRSRKGTQQYPSSLHSRPSSAICVVSTRPSGHLRSDLHCETTRSRTFAQVRRARRRRTIRTSTLLTMWMAAMSYRCQTYKMKALQLHYGMIIRSHQAHRSSTQLYSTINGELVIDYSQTAQFLNSYHSTMTSSKHVLIIGGSGRTGKLVIEELLRRNHKVTALVRKPKAMQNELNAGLKTVIGSPMDIQDVRNAFTQSQPEVIIVTLSAPRASDSPFAAVVAPPRLMADSTSNVVAVMKEFNTPKIVIMQAFGVGESWVNMHCVMQLLMKKSNMIYQYDDHNLVAKETKASGENYVFVRPSRLVEGEAKEIKEYPGHGKGVPVLAAITRESVAKFLVDAAEKSDWDNTTPVITN